MTWKIEIEETMETLHVLQEMELDAGKNPYNLNYRFS